MRLRNVNWLKTVRITNAQGVRIRAFAESLRKSRGVKSLHYLTASLEDYLEVIHILRQNMSGVGVTDIAKAMGISKPSVTRAIKSLKNNSLVIQEKYGKIVLTSEGEKIAESVYSRHKVLRKFLTDVLDISAGTAEIDACKIEHVISKETLEGIKKFLKNKGIEG